MSKIDEAHIARLKKAIGFGDEPVKDAQGYWTIGYGRRLNDKPGGPQPAATISEAMADEELRYRVSQQVDQLAALGRGSDTEIAHVALGEIVLPTLLQTPEVMRALTTAAQQARLPLDRLRVGMPENSINPRTNVPEFGVFDWVSGLFGDSGSSKQPIPITDDQRTMANAGDVDGFWRSRQNDGDPVAQYGLDSLHPPGGIMDYLFGGSSINNRLNAFSRVYTGHDADLPAIRKDLMDAHIDAVDADHEGVKGLLNPGQIYDHHQNVLRRYGLPSTAYGGSPFTGSRNEANVLSPFYCWNCDE